MRFPLLLRPAIFVFKCKALFKLTIPDCTKVACEQALLLVYRARLISLNGEERELRGVWGEVSALRCKIARASNRKAWSHAQAA